MALHRIDLTLSTPAAAMGVLPEHSVSDCRRIQGRQEQLLDVGRPVKGFGKAAMLVVVFWSPVQVPKLR